MRRNIWILLCSMLFGLGVTGCLMIPRGTQAETAAETAIETAAETAAETATETATETAAEPARTVAWWSVMYETPNPERLPVQVRFQWLKGLE